MGQKKRYVFLGIIICGLFVISAKLLNVVKETYSRYRSDVDVAVQSTTGEMVCTLTVDTDETYIRNNTAYFKIRVKNYKEDVITATNVSYHLTITNEDGSNGTYYYIDSEGNTSSPTGDYTSSITSQEFKFGTAAEEREFTVYVKVPSNLREQVNFKVDLDAIQIEA